MKVVVYATKPGGFWDGLVASAQRHKIQVDVLGWQGQWKGFGHRLLAMQEYVRKLPDREIVVFVDAYDVVFLRNLADLATEYEHRCRTNGDRIVLSTETRGPGGVFFQVFFGQCAKQNINAGTYIGYAYLLRKVFGRICADPRLCADRYADDQYMLTRFCDRNREAFAFDMDSSWFLIWGMKDIGKDIKIENGRFIYNGKQPYILHCPGNRDMGKLLHNLGYKVPPTSRRGHIEYFLKTVPFSTRSFLNRHPRTLTFLALVLASLMIARIRGNRTFIS